MKDCPRLPHDIAVVLASDLSDVALPIIESSPVLTDIDLIEIIRSRELEQRVAVARRRKLSERVSATLVDTEQQPVVVVLTANLGANIMEFSYLKIINTFTDDETITGNVIRRPVLPRRIVKILYDLVSGNLYVELNEHHPPPGEITDELVFESTDDEILEFVDWDAEPEEVEEIVRQIRSADRLSLPLIIQSFCLGQTKFFETAIAEIANIPIENSRFLIYDTGPRGLDSLRKVTACPPALIEVVRLVVETSSEIGFRGDPRDHAHLYERVVKQLDDRFDGQASRNLGSLLAALAG